MSLNNPPYAQSIANIADIIRQKERELHDIHDLRCNQLEALLQERDTLLMDASRRFEQLKEDFKYNLALIEARDQEINRLEGIVKVQSKTLEDSNIEIKQLNTKVDLYETKESERTKKLEHEKITNKRILDELKDVIESMRWSAEEDSKSKAREIELLKNDINHLNQLREDSLESQRKDLTKSFEIILQKREDSFIQKEKEISKQIIQLDNRFEQLMTENNRLKADLFQINRKNELLSNEVAVKDEQYRSLHYQLEDERNVKHKTDDGLARKVNQLTMDLAITKDAMDNAANSYEKQIEKVTNDYQREKEYRMSLEKRIEELRNNTQQDLKNYENELNKSQINEQNLLQQILGYREERDRLLNKLSNNKIEFEAYEQKYRTIEIERNGLVDELMKLNNYIHNSDIQLEQITKNYNDYRHDVIQREANLVAMTSEQINSFKENLLLKNNDDIKEMKENFEKNEKNIIQNYDEKIINILKEQDNLQLLYDNKCKEIEELHGDIEALKLRLRLYETQILDLQKEIRNLKNNTSNNNNPRIASIPLNHDTYYNNYDLNTSHFNNNNNPNNDSIRNNNGVHFTVKSPRVQQTRKLAIDTDDDLIGSPMFSEDYGPVSFPDSPSPRSTLKNHLNNNNNNNNMIDMDHYSPELPYPINAGMSGIAQPRSDKPPRPIPANSNHYNYNIDNPLTSDISWENDYHQLIPADNHDNNTVYVLKEENERLKQVVREMRADVEKLKMVGSPSPMKGLNTPNESKNITSINNTNGDKAEILERRLKQAADEVIKLRNERKVLMDVGNELRATLNKKNEGEFLANTDSMGQPPPSDKREESDSLTNNGSKIQSPSLRNDKNGLIIKGLNQIAQSVNNPIVPLLNSERSTISQNSVRNRLKDRGNQHTNNSTIGENNPWNKTNNPHSKPAINTRRQVMNYALGSVEEDQ
eukprot:gene13803-18513_t